MGIEFGHHLDDSNIHSSPNTRRELNGLQAKVQLASLIEKPKILSITIEGKKKDLYYPTTLSEKDTVPEVSVNELIQRKIVLEEEIENYLSYSAAVLELGGETMIEGVASVFYYEGGEDNKENSLAFQVAVFNKQLENLQGDTQGLTPIVFPFQKFIDTLNTINQQNPEQAKILKEIQHTLPLEIQKGLK